jgi:hypothetical protein
MMLLQGSGYSTSPMGRMGETAGGMLDYLIVLAAIIAVVISTTLMVRWLIRPGEDAPDHIKRLILDDGWARPTTRSNQPRRFSNP